MDLIFDLKPSLCFFTETWLHSSDTSMISQFPSYFTFIHRSRNNDKPGGGIGILVNNNDFNINSYNYLDLYSCEATTACISSKSRVVSPYTKFNIIIIYRPPNKNDYSLFFDEFSDLVLNSDPINTIIVGDLNFHFNSLVSPHSDFCILLDTLSLLQHITFPTHIKGNTLDYVITNCKANIISNTISSSLISDHFSIVFNIDIPKSHIISNACSYRRIDSIDTNIFVSDFNDLVFPGIDITQLNGILDLLLNKHAPLVTPKISNTHRAPWYNKTLANLKRRTRYYERYFVKERSDISYELFRKVRSEYRNSIKEFKIKYIKNTIECCSINSRKCYSLINNLTGR